MTSSFDHARVMAAVRPIMLIAGVIMALAFAACNDDGGPVAPDAGSAGEFGFPFIVGTTWTYDFTESYHEKDTYSRTLHGLHLWRLTGVDGTGIPRTYAFISEATDTVSIRQRTAPNGAIVETNYIYRSDVPFTATVSADSITFRWSAPLGYVNREAERLARSADDGSATVSVQGTVGGAIAYTAVYERGVGLRSFQQSLSAMSGAYVISLTLVTIQKP